jgi:arylsulfatase A-like enzyme
VTAQDNKPARQLRVRHRALTTALLLLLSLQAAPAAAAPNVLVVLTDDQRADGTMDAMPQTRRLIGRQGTTFVEAHATTPKCCPSRATFFTGLYAHNHRVTNNNVPARLDQSKTVQRYLQDRGYRTAIFGKFLNAWPLQIDPPYFDEWAIMNSGFREATWNDNGDVGRIRRHTTDLISERAIGFIRRAERLDDDQPWLTWLTPYAPHLPSTPAARHRDAPLRAFPTTPAILEQDTSDKPDFLDRARGYPEELVKARDDGRRTLMAVDEMVARLVAELKRREELRSTLIVFASDNGMLLGEHGGLVGKDLPYPASTRVPLLVRWPERMPARAERRDFVTNADVAATILAAAGVRRQTDGSSLATRTRRTTAFSEAFGARNNRGTLVLPPWRSLRTRGYRYAEYYKPDGDLLFREYYNLETDPWELDNSAPGLVTERAVRLSRRLAELSRCKGGACP